jgi:hypothetical protein
VEREKDLSVSGGKEVWRRGWEDVDALRRLIDGGAVGMSVDLLFGG